VLRTFSVTSLIPFGALLEALLGKISDPWLDCRMGDCFMVKSKGQNGIKGGRWRGKNPLK